MNDDFMLTGLRTPRPELAARVRERLRQVDAERHSHWRRRVVLRTAAQAAVLLLVVGVFAFPGVRAGAESFLDLFRVVNFTAVPVQQERVKLLMAQHGLDLPRMLGEQVKVVKAPGANQMVATAEEAGALAGIRVVLPAWQPVGLEQQRIDVSTDQSWSITASAEKLQHVLDAFAINDLSVPDRIDGQMATVYIHPAVRVTYGGPAGHGLLIQSRQPQASLPAGVDLPQLAQIGLRVLGMERKEAARFAQSVDWRTTLLCRCRRMRRFSGRSTLMEIPDCSSARRLRPQATRDAGRCGCCGPRVMWCSRSSGTLARWSCSRWPSRFSSGCPGCD